MSDKQQCDRWREADEELVVCWTTYNNGWSIVLQDPYPIEYCPFCGSELDKDGCTGESAINQNIFVPIEEKQTVEEQRDELLEVVKIVDDVQCNFPQWWYEQGFDKTIKNAIAEVEGDSND